jgi:hypothetical protein
VVVRFAMLGVMVESAWGAVSALQLLVRFLRRCPNPSCRFAGNGLSTLPAVGVVGQGRMTCEQGLDSIEPAWGEQRGRERLDGGMACCAAPDCREDLPCRPPMKPSRDYALTVFGTCQVGK